MESKGEQPMDRRMIISVIGESSARPRIALLAEQVGAELARRGIIVACGGLGGVMEAACRGAKSAGGTTIGILPGDNPLSGNDYIDIPIITGMGYARNTIVAKTGAAVIAVGGAYGTLSEIGHALGDGIPVIGLETWELIRGGAPDGGQDHSIIRANDAADAAQKAIAAANRRLSHIAAGKSTIPDIYNR